MTLWEQLLFLLIAFAVSFSICGILIRSPNFLMDVPNYRSLHAEPVPRGGGMAFGLGFLVCLGGLLFLYYPESLNQAMAALFAGCILVYLLGLLDDALALPALFRLALQTFIAFVLCRHGAPEKIHFFGLFELYGWPALAVQVFWILTCINLMNFLDGLDGLVGTLAILFSLTLGLLLWMEPHTEILAEPPEIAAHLQQPVVYRVLAIAFFCLAAAILGFLFWNAPRARIFMGDGGSYLLGFVFGFPGIILPYDPGMIYTEPRAEVTVLWTSPYYMDHLMILILWFPLLLDPAMTIVRRLFAGENVLLAHREHLFQLFRRNGWSIYRITALYVVSFLAILPLILMKMAGHQFFSILLALSGLGILYVLFFLYMYRRLLSNALF